LHSLISCIFITGFACHKQPPADVTDPGQRLFLGYVTKEVNCSRCHGEDALGRDKAPDLTKVFKKYDADKIAEIIEEGKGLGKEAMPPFEGKVTEEDIENLVKFLQTIQSTD